MAGDHQPAAGTDEGAHQAVERDIATGRQARLRRCRGTRLAGGVAGREDDQVGVEVQVKDVLERQQPIRAVAAEAGEQRRLRGALGRSRGDHAVGREVQDAVLVEVLARLDRGIGELVASNDLDAGRIELPDDRARDLELLGRDGMGP